MHRLNMEHLLVNLLESLSISCCTLVNLSHSLRVAYSEGLWICSIKFCVGLLCEVPQKLLQDVINYLFLIHT